MANPSAGLLLLQISRFGGLNKRVSKFLIADDQCQDILNFVFDERGALSKISGFVQWNATSLGASGMLGGERFYKTGATTEFVEAHNGKLFKGVDSTKTFTEIATGFNLTAKWGMKINRDLLFMVNGVDENKKWNGTTVTKMGLVAPTAALTAATGAAGNLNGAYTWVYTFVSPTHESNASPVSSSLTLTNQQASLTGIAVSSDTQVTKRRIYRTAAGGTDRKFVGEINDNVTTAFTDNIADSSLGVDVPIDKNVPIVNKFIEAFKNRLWLAGDPNNPRRLYFSELFEPEAWPTSFFVDIPMTPGDEITCLRILGDVLVVYGHNTPFMVIGETPFDFTIKRSFAQAGTESDRTVRLIENAHIYLARGGIYAFDGAVGRLLSDDIHPVIRELPAGFLKNSAAEYHEKNKVYRLAVTGPGNTTNSKEIIYDLRNNASTISDRSIAYYHHLDGPGDTGQLFSASPTAGVLNEEDTGTTANGSAILVKWKGKAYTLGVIDFTKFLRHSLLWLQPNEDVITLEIKLDEDGAKAQTFTLGASAALSLYGTALYGTAIYSGPGLVRIANPLSQTMRGNYCEIAIESSSLKAIKIFSIELSYRSHPNLRIR